MANYKSAYTGAEIDAGIGKANTAIQDVSDKQNKIDSSHKLSADLISNGSTNKVVTQSEKTTWSGKQDALVSGTNIKTINNESILGNGNITISGGDSTDVKINGTSITSEGEANIVTETAYDASTNKIATMSDVPDISVKQDKIDSSHKLSAALVDDSNSTNKFVTASDKTNWNAKGTYSKPSGGIPKTDLTSEVQTSLGKADTAIQSSDLTGRMST